MFLVVLAEGCGPVLFASILLALGAARAGRLHPLVNNERQALTVQDALLTIPDASGRILLLGDLDEDGIPELAVQRGDGSGSTSRIDAVSARDGHVLRTLWRMEGWSLQISDWDAGGDLDGDCIPDLIVGLARTTDGETHGGCVLAISGATGETLHATYGDSAPEGYGSSVLFLGDANGDGRDDFAVGAVQAPALDERTFWVGVANADNSTYELENGSLVDERDFREERLDERGGWLGYVSARSGEDGSELWRRNGERIGHAFGARLCALGDSVRAGVSDVLVQSDLISPQAFVRLSGNDGEIRARVRHAFETVAPAGDLDEDGVGDFSLFDRYDETHFHRARFVSGRTRQVLFLLDAPYDSSEFAIAVDLGDLDGDGVDDIALGDADVNIDPDELGWTPDLRLLSVGEALGLKANGGCAFTWESGAAIVCSGRTQQPLMGVFGTPGSSGGLGLQVLGLPDMNSDGYRDLLVADDKSA